MADLLGGIPFGIDDMLVEARDGTGTLSGTGVDVFGATSISLSTESDTQDARGDNEQKRVTRSNKTASGSVGMLTHDPALLAVIGDGTTTTSGTTPATVTTYTEPAKTKSKHFQLMAQAYDGAAAARITVPDAITSGGPNFDWSTDSYSEPGFDYEAQSFDAGGAENVFYTLEVYETAEDLAAQGGGV